MIYNNYHTAIKLELEEFAKDEKVRFLGQQTASENFYSLLTDIPLTKRTEMPIVEELQVGLCTGLALEGYLPICIIQRMDFLLRCSDQIANHLDKIKSMSRNTFSPKVIIFTTVGTTEPLNCGPQHCQDFTEAFQKLVKFPVIRIDTVEQVKETFDLARTCEGPIMIIVKQELF